MKFNPFPLGFGVITQVKAPPLEFDTTAFFDGIVSKLHEDGTLRSYDAPKGTPHLDWEDWTKDSHHTRRHIPLLGRFLPRLRDEPPGTVAHIGDEPYSVLTTGQLQYYREFLPDQADMDLKVASVREAINRYMPPDAFAAYLEYFQQHLDLPAHQAAIRKSIGVLRYQAWDARSDKQNIHDVIDARSGSYLREALGDAPISNELIAHPTLAFSVVVYHAAHTAYLEQLKTAVERAADARRLDKEETRNALFTLNTGSFHQFQHFLLFASLVPLTLNRYATLGKDDPTTQVEAPSITHHGSHALENFTQIDTTDHARMKEALSAGWKDLIRKKILVREYDANASSPAEGEKPDKRMVCPAHAHLQASAKDHLIEGVYAFALDHPEKTQGTLQMIQQMMSTAPARHPHY